MRAGPLNLNAGDAALEIGLITRVVRDDSPHDEAFAMARTLAGSAPLTLAATKRLV